MPREAHSVKQIQLLLAAHFTTCYDGVVQSQSAGGEWSVSYGMVIGQGIKSSMYGQQAIVMDTTGKLAKLDLKRAKFQVVSHYNLYGSTYLQTLVD